MPSIMFEGQFNRADLRETRDAADLRRFRWTDLVARLAATRDLKDEIDRTEGGFGAFADARRERDRKSKESINHDASASGKLNGVSPADAAEDAAQGDRETE